MKKLHKITIKNFQSIANAEIELGDITIITGKSRCGKSAFYRAVKGAVENISGDSFITFGEKKTEVALDNVVWIQTKTKNEYRIGEELFEKCGRTVPEAIQNELNMGKVEFGDGVKENLNFSDQLGQIFFVQGKGSDNAKIVGSITNLHKIYNGLRDAQKDLNNEKSNLKTDTKLLEQYQEERTTIGDELKEVDRKYKIAKRVYEIAKRVEERADNLNRIGSGLRGILEKKHNALKRIKRFKGIDSDRGRAICQDLQGLKRIYSISTQLYSDSIRFKGAYRSIMGVLANKPRITLTRLENLLEGQYKADTISEKKGEIEVKQEVVKKKLNELRLTVDSFEVCDLCGADKKHWNL